MSDSPFQSFIDLISVDQAIMALRRNLATLTREIETLKSQEATLVRELERAQKEAHDAQKDVDAKELDMKTLEERAQESKKRLDDVHNVKEYEGIKREIEQIKRQQHNLEAVLMTVWNRLETSKKELESKTQKIDEALSSIRASISEKEQMVENFKTQVEDQNAIRPAKEKKVPEEWLEKYAVMRAQVEDPVVPVVQGSCSACFYPITEQDLLSLKRRKLLQCKGCYRFLYVEQPDQSDDDTAPAT